MTEPLPSETLPAYPWIWEDEDGEPETIEIPIKQYKDYIASIRQAERAKVQGLVEALKKIDFCDAPIWALKTWAREALTKFNNGEIND